MTCPAIQKRFSSDLSKALLQLDRFMDQVKEQYQPTERDLFQLRMILEELISNSIHHGFSAQQDRRDENELIDVALTMEEHGSCYRILYRDNGPAFDSSTAKVPKELAKTQAMSFGGMGLDLIHQLVQDFQYRYEDEKNIIRIRKHRLA